MKTKKPNPVSGQVTCDVDVPVQFYYPGIPTKDLIAELKRRGVDVHPANMPFIQKPNAESKD